VRSMEIHIKTHSSDRRLLWIALTVVAIVLTWNVVTVYVW